MSVVGGPPVVPTHTVVEGQGEVVQKGERLDTRAQDSQVGAGLARGG